MTELHDALAHITRITPPSAPWTCFDLGGGRGPVLTDSAIATILNAVASGALVPATDADALAGAVLQEAARVLDTAGDSAVTEALGQQLCCSGHHCGCQGADVGTFLQHLILALRPEAPAALARALQKAREVKPLVFDEKDCADGIGCRYLLAKDYDGWRWFQTSLGGVLENVSTRVFRERNAVRNAAQADYAARIHAALQPGDGQ